MQDVVAMKDVSAMDARTIFSGAGIAALPLHAL